MTILRDFLDAPVKADEDVKEPPASYNVKPTQQVSMLVGTDQPLLTAGRWWFVPHWFRGDVSEWKQTRFNARI